jgi:hypothetical protein
VATSGQKQVLNLLEHRFAIDISLWISVLQLYNAAKIGDEKIV